MIIVIKNLSIKYCLINYYVVRVKSVDWSFRVSRSDFVGFVEDYIFLQDMKVKEYGQMVGKRIYRSKDEKMW